MMTAHIPEEPEVKSASTAAAYVSGLTVVALLLLRPTLWGGTFSAYGLVILTLLTFIVSAIDPTGRLFYRPGNPNRMDISTFISIATISLWIYLIVSALLKGESTMMDVYKGGGLAIGVSLCSLVLLTRSELNYLIFKWFARINSLCGWSILCSIIMIKMIGYAPLLMTKINIWNYEFSATSGDVLFPFTVVYAYFEEYDLYRFAGIARESGIAQAFFCWSALYFKFEKARNFWMLGALAGSLLCGSTISYITLGVAFAIAYFKRHGNSGLLNFSLVLGAVAIVMLTLYSPGVGIIDKQTTHAASTEDRQQAIKYAIADNDNFWTGHGLGYIYTPTSGLGVNGISQIYFIGLVGLILFSLQFIMGPFVLGKRSRDYIAIISPLYITALFSQPLLDAPLVIFLLYYIPPSSLDM